ncbi:MAG: nucleotidyltransferase family protein [Pseudomonadales bacterium]
MILAAGEGQRMQPLTRDRPKALLPVNGRPLIQYLVESLAQAGFQELVINLFYRGEMIEKFLGEGERFEMHIRYIRETELLETGGGILNALPLLGSEPFAVINADLYTEFDFTTLKRPAPQSLGHLVMVDNPAHRTRGDFGIDKGGRLSMEGERLTYSGIGVLSPRLFETATKGRFPLRDLLIPAVAGGHLTGEHFREGWIDVGTPERYHEACERAGEQT